MGVLMRTIRARSVRRNSSSMHDIVIFLMLRNPSKHYRPHKGNRWRKWQKNSRDFVDVFKRIAKYLYPNYALSLEAYSLKTADFLCEAYNAE